MGDGLDELDRMIEGLRRLKGMPEKVAARAAAPVQAALRATTAAGTAPDGTPWPARKKDGGRALANAAEATTVTAHGRALVMRVTGPEAIHHKGTGTGRIPRRPQLPDGDVPPRIVAAIKGAAAEVWDELLGST